MLPDALARMLDLTGVEWRTTAEDEVTADAVIELGVLAGEILACRAAAPFTFGASELAIPDAVRASGRILDAIFERLVAPTPIHPRNRTVQNAQPNQPPVASGRS